MIPWLGAADLRRHLGCDALVPALREAFAAGFTAPVRHTHRTSPDGASTLLLMPVWQADRRLGVKLVTVTPGNRASGRRTVNGLFVLFDNVSGEPIALMDGEELTLARTAAASALASTYLSREDSRTLVMVGTGALAPRLALAHASIRRFERVLVWGRDPAKAMATADELTRAGCAATVATDLEAAVREADVVSCATTSREPLVRGDWVRPGTHVDLVGAFRPDMREADDALIARATVVVDTFAGALAEAGDLVQALGAGAITQAHVVAEMTDLARGHHPGRVSADEITLFKSVGSAIEDLAAADLAWSRHNRE